MNSELLEAREHFMQSEDTEAEMADFLADYLLELIAKGEITADTKILEIQMQEDGKLRIEFSDDTYLLISTFPVSLQ